MKEKIPSGKFTLGFSPCPNDTFMFDALVHQKIDTAGVEFDVVLEDVETLNKMALAQKLDISKVSYAAFLRMTGHYQMMNSGSALGNGVGPLVIALNEKLNPEDPAETIAIPGVNTTANFLFSAFFPHAKHKKEMLFSEIEDAVLSGKTSAGVIIHENRFTYQQKGLKKICDLGELWENKTKLPIPLGGIAVRKNLPTEVKQKIEMLIRKSVEYAFANPDSSASYVAAHAQEMNEEVRRMHIQTYVNDFSADLGMRGRSAIRELFRRAFESGIISRIPEDIFIDSLTEMSNR